MRAVNLLPKETSRSKSRKAGAPVILAVAAPVVAGVLVFAGYRLEHASLAKKQLALETAQARVKALPVAKQPPPPAETGIANDRTARRTALDAALTDRLPWDATLVDLARVLPGDVWLTSLGLISPTPADASAPTGSTATGFSISGYTYSEDSVARLLTRLQVLPTITGVTLVSTTTSAIGTKNLVQFSVSAAIVAPTAVAPTAVVPPAVPSTTGTTAT